MAVSLPLFLFVIYEFAPLNKPHLLFYCSRYLRCLFIYLVIFACLVAEAFLRNASLRQGTGHCPSWPWRLSKAVSQGQSQSGPNAEMQSSIGVIYYEDISFLTYSVTLKG